MPIYEYKREDGTIFEIVQKITEKPLIVCPTTGQKVERIFSTFSAHFRGPGFYKTDYKDVETQKKNKKKTVVEGKVVKGKGKANE